MIEIVGDLWNEHAAGAWACVTTNGETNSRGHAIMGRGVALQAKQRYAQLPDVLGSKLRTQGNAVYWFPEWRLITFPTKHRWRELSDVELIAHSVLQLAALIKAGRIAGNRFERVVLPRPGCANGGLRWADVRPFCEQLDDSVHVICQPWEVLGGG